MNNSNSPWFFKGKYSILSKLPTPDIAKISILRTEIYFLFTYSNASLVNPFCITNIPFNKRFYEPYFLSREPKVPQYNERKALNTAESKEKKYILHHNFLV